MKNRLLPLLFVLGSYSAYSQVGIGKLNPDASAQLEVYATDKGMLIPRVTLTGSTDITTIAKGNKESLLVFNMATVSDVKPGYYYWSVSDNSWQRLAISSEVTGGIAGLAGGSGAPGMTGVTVPGDATTWIDTTTGHIYVKDASGNWVKINGLDGKDGKDGVIGGKGIPGAKGETNYPGDNVVIYIDSETGTIYVRDPENKDKWIPLSGKNGIDGIKGIDGAPGTAGTITTLDAIVKDANGNIYAYVGDSDTVAGRDAEWASKSPNWVKINGLDGKDGKDGVIGGKGIPGSKGETGYPGDNVAIYIDNETGTVYVRDPNNNDKWIPLSGKNGIDGIKGIDGAPGTAGTITTLDAIVKDANGNIYAYVGESDTVAGRDAEWASKSPNWVKINGLNGEDGITGATGEPGTAGSITTLDAIIKSPNGDIYVYTGTDKTVAGRDAEWASKSPNWVKINGLDGKDGKDGVIGGKGIPGSKGETGYPGDNVAIYIDNETGTVYVRDPNNNDKWIPLSGKNGIDGIKGIDGAPGTAGTITTLDAIVKDANGNIYAYVGESDTVAGRDAEWASKSPNWVKINGLNGEDGITGATGEPGTAGSITTLDAIIKSPNGDIYVYTGTDKTVAGRDAEWASKSPNWVKINGLDGKDGKDGVIGGKGIPGSKGETGYPGDNVAIYIDNETGTVYVRDPNNNDKWIPLSGKNGIDGIKGIDGAPGTAGTITTLDAIVKDANGNIYAYVGESDTVAGRDAEWASKSPNWVKINGLNGEDGITGATGEPGTAGSITTLDAIIKSPNGDIYVYTGTDKTVAGRDAEWASKSPNWVKINGLDGKDGKDGVIGGKGIPGSKGETGYPGDNVAIYIDNETGTVYVRDPNNNDKWIPLSGKNGIDGIKGIDGAPGTAGTITTLDAIVKDANGNIYAYVGESDTVAGRDAEWASKSPNWVKINGLNGEDGITGATGEPGTAGSITTLDAIIKSPNGDIYVYTGTDKTVAGRDAEWVAKSPNWVKINGNDGVSGLAGGPGAPGAPGVTIPADATTWIDTETGIVYVKDANDKWVKVNGKDGVDGAAGFAGGPGVPGDPGVTIPASTTTWIDTTTGNVYVLDPITKEWVKVSGANGKDGKSFTYADFTADELAGLKGADGVTSFVPTVTEGNTIATFTDAAGNPAAIKETVTSLKDVVTQTTDERGQVFDKHTLTYTDEAGVDSPIDMSTLVKGVETLTSLQYDGSLGELNYKDEAGVTTSFNMVDMVGANQTLTKLVINSDEGTLDYTDENKALHPLNLADLVKEPWYGVDSKKGATLNTDNIYTQGWVGIGFDTPSTAANEKLRVNGAITTVNSYYADYVFEDYFKGFSDIKADYKFKKLDEVDAFIKKNKHLPGITPINELMKTKEGYSFNVSELSIQLLEKTEELYLHIIEQDKELEAKNNEIEKLKVESKSLKAATDEMNARLEKLEKLMSNK